MMMKFYNMLKRGAINFPSKILISINHEVFNYKYVFEEVLEIKRELKEFKIEGLRIGILNSNLYFQLVYFLGVLASGNVPIIIHENISDEDLNLLIYKENLHILRDKNISDLQGNSKDIYSNNSNCFGVLSSGTTGLPKLIFRSEESWVKSFNYQSDLFNLKKEPKVFIHGFFSFTANLNYAIHILNLGGSIITTTSIMPGDWIKRIKVNNINGIFLVPSKYKILLKRCNERLPLVESVLSAGEKLNIEVAKNISRIFNKAEIIEYYGSSETSYISYNKYDNIMKNENGVGFIFPGVKVSIVNNEIYVDSKYMALGYGEKFKVIDKGFFNENGVLCLSGRYKKIVNKAGVKININNIEKALKSIKYIEDYIVFSFNDKIKGEDVVAAVILTDNSLGKIDIIKSLRGKLNKQEIPRFLIVDKFPFNISGKINIKDLKEFI